MDRLKLKQDIELALIASNISSQPKHILAEYLVDCLDVFIRAQSAREHWLYSGGNNNSATIILGDRGITVMGGCVTEFSTEPIDKQRGSE